MNYFLLYRNVPADETKFDWYNKLAKAVEVFAPKNSNCVIVGIKNAIVLRFSDDFTPNNNTDVAGARYFAGRLGELDVYVDAYYNDEITYEARSSSRNLENGVNTSIIGVIKLEEE